LPTSIPIRERPAEEARRRERASRVAVLLKVSPGHQEFNGLDNGYVAKPGRILRITGNVFLVAGFLVAAYVAWLLWGTGVYTSRAQGELRQDLAARIQDPRSGELSRSRVLPGEALAILRIPKIDMDTVVIEGTDIRDLKKGPGHYRDTAYPWEDKGKVGIAGHRTTYGAPFWSLDKLRRGDRITLATEFGTFDYQVTRTREVLPTQTDILQQTRDPTLVLTTCTPRFSAARRLIVFADRMDPPA
jgi:sortase A